MEKAKKAKRRMFAVVQIVCDLKDPEDSDVKIVGVYSTKKRAEDELNKVKTKFLKDVDDDVEFAERLLEDDCDRMYDWRVEKVSVELAGGAT